MDQNIADRIVEAQLRLNELSAMYASDTEYEAVEIAAQLIRSVSALQIVEGLLQKIDVVWAKFYISKIIDALESSEASALNVQKIACLSRAIGRMKMTMELNIVISAGDLNHLDRTLLRQGFVLDGVRLHAGQA